MVDPEIKGAREEMLERLAAESYVRPTLRSDLALAIRHEVIEQEDRVWDLLEDMPIVNPDRSYTLPVQDRPVRYLTQQFFDALGLNRYDGEHIVLKEMPDGRAWPTVSFGKVRSRARLLALQRRARYDPGMELTDQRKGELSFHVRPIPGEAAGEHLIIMPYVLAPRAHQLHRPWAEPYKDVAERHGFSPSDVDAAAEMFADGYSFAPEQMLFMGVEERKIMLSPIMSMRGT